MTNKSRIKIIFALIGLVTVFATLYHLLHQSKQKLEWDLSWDKGFKAKSERIYYVNSIRRLISDWALQKWNEIDSEGKYKDPNDRYLVIDLDKQVIWMEQNGKIQEGNYIEFPPETEWDLYYCFPGGNTKLSGRLILKNTGYDPKHMAYERFILRGLGSEIGISFIFSSIYFADNSINKSSNPELSLIKKTDEPFESIIVSEGEYQQYRNSLTDSVALQSEDINLQPKALTRLERNKQSWYGIRRNLYMEIEKQFKNYDCRITKISDEPGPDFSAARIRIEAKNNPNITNIPEEYQTHFDTYLNVDNLVNGVWYAKSVPNPYYYWLPKEEDNNLPNIEFVVSSEQELLKVGRELQNSNPIPESKWEATLSNGATFRIIGICDHPSVGKQWWDPDGSSLNFVPFINSNVNDKPSEGMNIFEFAWVTKDIPQGLYIKTTYVDGEKTFGLFARDKYGDFLPDHFHASARTFDKSKQAFDFKLDVMDLNYKTAITINDKAEEISFLDKYRVIINPPELVNGNIIIRCYEDFRSNLQGYDTHFGLIANKEAQNKNNISYLLDTFYKEDIKDDDITGLREHKYIVDNINIDQIEGVCFYYRKYSVITFKNISLVPGQDQGFEIEVIEAEE